MDAIGLLQPITTQVLPAPTSQVSAPVVVSDSSQSAPLLIGGGSGGPADFDASTADQRRFQAVQQVAQEIANIYVVSDKTFSIFKDVTGQYITRFTSLRDGKVTYIPEPTLFKMASSAADVQPLLKINA